MMIRIVPFVFVILWASGFIGAKFGLQHSEPLTLLSLRFAANVVLFSGLLIVLRRRLPSLALIGHSMVVGVLIHAAYLAGCFTAISLGMPAGLVSLLVGLQPLLTAVILVSNGRARLASSQWFGLLLGLIGISLVLGGKLSWESDAGWWPAAGFVTLALLGMTLGTLYQKRFCANVDLIAGGLIQYFAAALLLTPFALIFETNQIEWTPTFMAALAWLVFGLSFTAILLLLVMVRLGEASKVAATFYLVPPVTALQAWIAFGETMSWQGGIGFVLSAIAVYLVSAKPTAMPTAKQTEMKPKLL
ncbi:DMT family transporter [Thaumasiovibrio subtropicus]|uniref:DMT family transporter n=1 Tax=Thaumasiovibrio subtropicus TaxID=1891207 RepID=UPI000B35F161|nr:DMT family transporter [Thaumasiovibrio subtropicus]